MTIKTYKQAICDNCGCGIDVYPCPISSKRLSELVVDKGGLVFGRKHFCDAECYKQYSPNLNNTCQIRANQANSQTHSKTANTGGTANKPKA